MARALVNKLKEDKVYFPNFIAEIDYKSTYIKSEYITNCYITYATRIRIQGSNGKWYTLSFEKLFINDFLFGNSDQLQNFLEEAYRFSLLINEKPDYPFGELDELQISEEERMKFTLAG